MHPILIDWGPFFIPTWHFFFVMAAIVVYFSMRKSLAIIESTVSITDLNNLYLLGYVFGYLGARAISIPIEQADSVHGVSDFFSLLFSFGGLTFYGGFLVGTVACVSYVVYRKLPYWDLIDICIPSIFLGLVIGRLGCFFNGCDYGLPVALNEEVAPFYGFVFPVLEDSIPRYPTQLMESFAVALLVIPVLIKFKYLRSKLMPGSLGLLVVVSYAIIRFIIEYFRGDYRGWVINNILSTSQFISLSLVFVFALLWFFRSKQR